MKLIDEMPANEAIALYYEKHDLIRKGDMAKLVELKQKCPDIFDKEKDKEIGDMIDYMKAFQASDHYKELKKNDLKTKLSVINNETQK